MSREKLELLKQKIVKCFELSKSNNENESRTALKMAQELMTKYNIEEADLAGLNPDKESLQGAMVTVTLTTARYHRWVKTLSWALQSAFDCKAYYSRGFAGYRNTSITFYGIKHNVEAAAIAWDSLYHQVAVLSRKFKPSKEDWQHGKNTYSHEYNSFSMYSQACRFEYREGLTNGFYSTVKSQKEEEKKQYGESTCTALVVQTDKIAEQVLADHEVKLTNSKHTPSKGYGSGSDSRQQGVTDSNKLSIIGGHIA